MRHQSWKYWHTFCYIVTVQNVKYIAKKRNYGRQVSSASPSFTKFIWLYGILIVWSSSHIQKGKGEFSLCDVTKILWATHPTTLSHPLTFRGSGWVGVHGSDRSPSTSRKVSQIQVDSKRKNKEHRTLSKTPFKSLRGSDWSVWQHWFIPSPLVHNWTHGIVDYESS